MKNTDGIQITYTVNSLIERVSIYLKDSEFEDEHHLHVACTEVNTVMKITMAEAKYKTVYLQ